ncbi:hypothetical protein [uncultured Shewanella sp.]|uniref:hypothetical protein n=1 Tax=uncultured Shewanella sp. TaxID=173975 RepID=UPI002629460A|nr:hypothetical protein [uncultured Shewanella sp.]
MRLFQYQGIYSIVRVLFAIVLLQLFVGTVEANALHRDNVLVQSELNDNEPSDVDIDLNNKPINQRTFLLSSYSSTYASIYPSFDKQVITNTRNTPQASQYSMSACEQYGLDVDKFDKNTDLCDECKCHGGHIIFTSTLKFLVPHFFIVPANTQNLQYLPPAILLHAKPPIISLS